MVAILKLILKLRMHKYFLKSHRKKRVQAIKNEQELKLELKTINPEFT